MSTNGGAVAFIKDDPTDNIGVVSICRFTDEGLRLVKTIRLAENIQRWIESLENFIKGFAEPGDACLEIDLATIQEYYKYLCQSH